jgi:hypothetical protein
MRLSLGDFNFDAFDQMDKTD